MAEIGHQSHVNEEEVLNNNRIHEQNGANGGDNRDRPRGRPLYEMFPPAYGDDQDKLVKPLLPSTSLLPRGTC